MSFKLPLEAFSAQVSSNPQQVYLNQPHEGKWTAYTWAEVDDQARRIASALIAQGFEPGDRIAILSKNCAEWIIADLAIMMAGMISVPIYATAGVETIKHVISHSGSKAIFVGKLDELTAAEQALDDNILRISFPYPTMKADVGWLEWVSKYDPLADIAAPKPEDVLSIIYTSGSTGSPKGALITHANLGAAAAATYDIFKAEHRHRSMSYLPLAHITERASVEMSSFLAGVELFFTESLATFMADLQYAKPTAFVSVPRLWTRYQAEILARIPNNKLQRILKIPLLGKMVAKKIRSQLGLDEAVLFFSGSAPIPPALLEWYRTIGIDISEAWGMTETSGLACVNHPYEPEGLGTIGRPVDCVEMKLSEEGEVLIRGDLVFSEYYLSPELTKDSFIDEWFRTGDLGEINEHGHFKIIGRVKEQFKTAKGKFVAPVPIEGLISHNPDVEQVCVLGRGRKQPIAIVVLAEALRGDASILEDIRGRLHETLQQTNAQLESHECVDHIIVSQTEWTIDNNLLTPTLKIQRNKLEKIYEDYLTQTFSQVVLWENEIS